MPNNEKERFFFFVDDSGSKDWETPYAYAFTKQPPPRTEVNLKFWRGNYFVLAGLHISREAVATINPLINEAKQRYFGTKFVEMKSEWLRNPYQRKKHYLDLFHLEEARLRRFVEEEWYSFLSPIPMRFKSKRLFSIKDFITANVKG